MTFPVYWQIVWCASLSIKTRIYRWLLYCPRY